MASVQLDQIYKEYDNGFVAVQDASFTIEDGEFVVLVGPSGCGKSTTLRMIAGLESISKGTLRIGDRVVNDVAPKDRDIAMVFQNYALYPHMTVFDNMAFGLKLRKFPKAEIAQRVQEAADALGLDPVLDRKPKALSGGQRQRVALGRAIVRDPSVFLFDEPLSNLDAKLRVQTRTQISKLHRQLGATMIYVTHDQVEAMTMGDRIVVLKDGVVQQIAPPLDLYNHPANRFVAGFIGSPAMNFIEGQISPTSGDFESEAFTAALPRAGASEGGVSVGIRPEDVYVAGNVPTDRRVSAPFTLPLEVMEPMGNEVFVYAGLGEGQFVARVEPQPLPEPGQSVELVVDLDKLHAFDTKSGLSLAQPAAV
ncbi:MAG: sn-glycerol-3-phosphate ABC transporter ATP-binding protein UgpC [Rubricoccaceae bacterium]